MQFGSGSVSKGHTVVWFLCVQALKMLLTELLLDTSWLLKLLIILRPGKKICSVEGNVESGVIMGDNFRDSIRLCKGIQRNGSR